MSGTIFIYSAPFPEISGSIQLQAFIPARHLGAKVLYFGGDMSADAFIDRYRPDALIFTKIFDPHCLVLAEAAKARSIKIVGVFVDLHLTDKIGQSNTLLASLADVIVTPTEYLANRWRQHAHRDVSVINEPYRFPRRPVKFDPGATLRILWCGHDDNLDTLPAGVENLARYRDRPIALMIVSNSSPQLDKLAKLVGGMSLSFWPWSPQAHFELMSHSDVVFVPSFDTDAKMAKGHGRVVEPINAGRLAIAHPLPQYRELADYCLCDADYAASVRAALADPAAIRNMIGQGQRYVDERFAPEVIAEKWLKLIDCI
jgi:glycosyltransferase involved in cell wall biosynthesis